MAYQVEINSARYDKALVTQIIAARVNATALAAFSSLSGTVDTASRPCNQKSHGGAGQVNVQHDSSFQVVRPVGRGWG